MTDTNEPTRAILDRPLAAFFWLVMSWAVIMTVMIAVCS